MNIYIYYEYKFNLSYIILYINYYRRLYPAFTEENNNQFDENIEPYFTWKTFSNEYFPHN